MRKRRRLGEESIALKNTLTERIKASFTRKVLISGERGRVKNPHYNLVGIWMLGAKKVGKFTTLKEVGGRASPVPGKKKYRAEGVEGLHRCEESKRTGAEEVITVTCS